MEEWMWVVWLVIFAITMIVEVSVPDLVSIWFSIAAIVTLGLSFIDGLPYWGEIIIFVCLSLILLASTRRFIKKFLKNKETSKTNLETLVGKEVKLTKKVEKFSRGEVIISGVAWDCESSNGEEINENTTVKIIRLEGNKLIVEEVKE